VVALINLISGRRTVV